jgi:hypothetical protein
MEFVELMRRSARSGPAASGMDDVDKGAMIRRNER